MPDYSFIANPQTSSGLQSLSSIMNTANAAQQLQMNRLNVQQKQQTIDADIAQRLAESRVAQETAGPKIAQEQAVSKGAQFKLEGDYAQRAMQFASGLMQDPRIAKSDPIGTIDAANEAYSGMVSAGIPKQTADFWASQIKAKAHQPGAALQLLQNVTRQGAGLGTQAGVINAPVSMVQTPAGAIAPLQLQPGAPGAVEPVPISSLQAPSGVIPAGIPPAQVQQPAVDVLGQPVIAEKDQTGRISYKAPPGSNYKPVMQFPQGENAQTLPEVQAIRTQANALGAAAPDQHFNNKMILDLAPDAFTGTGSGKLASALNAIGIKNITPESLKDPAESKALITHFIALQVQKNAAAMGANTDAARTIAAQAVLPSDSPEKAIKNVTKVNDAYVTGNELYNKGMEAAINNPTNQAGPFAARQFRNAWAANFDPRITLLENAQISGDTETIDRILGSKGSPQRAKATAELLPKAKALQALSQGRM